MATMTFEPMAVPLCEDEYGAIRVGNTRVLLDLVIHAFREGASAEGIVESYDALNLADVLCRHQLLPASPRADRRSPEA